MPPKSFPAVRRSDRKPHKTRLFSALAGVVGPEIILILAYVVKQTSLAVDDNAANRAALRGRLTQRVLYLPLQAPMRIRGVLVVEPAQARSSRSRHRCESAVRTSCLSASMLAR